MTPKTLRILLIIFVILILTASFDWWSKFLPFKKPPSPPEVNITQFNESSIDKFTIKKGTDEKRLTKGPNGWFVNDQPATPSSVRDFFAGVAGLTIGDLVSKNPQNHPNFGVTEDGYMLTFTQGATASAFIIGDTSPDYTSFYLKQKDSSNVYLANGTLRNQLTLDLNSWLASPSATTSTQTKTPYTTHT